jgi:molybdenum cofactor cytidylyltransferase
MKEMIFAVLMASGFSRRFGDENKLLFPFRGKPLARYTLELAASMDAFSAVFFVAADDAVAALAKDLPQVTLVRNKAPDKESRESVRLGVEAAEARARLLPSADVYYAFFPCDQPFLDAPTVRRILDSRRPSRIVEPRYQGKPGNPCLFSGVFRDELLNLGEGETPRQIKTRHQDCVIPLEFPSALPLTDIDTLEDAKRL